MLKKFFSEKRIIDFIILFLLVGTVYAGWFKSGYITRTDLFQPSDEWMEDSLSIPYMWSDEFGGYGVPVWLTSHYPLQFAWAAIWKYSGLSIDTAMRIVWFFPVIILSVFSMYYLSNLLFKNRIASFFSSLLFAVNPIYLLYLSVGYPFGPYAIAVTPFVIAFFIKSLHENTIRNAVIAGIALSLAIYADLKIAIISVGILLLFAAYHIIFEAYLKNKNFHSAKKAIGICLKSFIFLFIATALLNMFWLVPALAGRGVSVPSGTEQPAYANIANINPLIYSMGISFKSRTDLGQIALPAALFIAAVSFSAVLLYPKNRTLAFLALMAILFIFLSKGAQAPIGNLYHWMYSKLPFFVAFRASDKFLLPLVMTYALLFGMAVNGFTRLVTDSHFLKEFKVSRNASKYILLAFFAITVFLPIIPSIAGQKSMIYGDPAGSTLNPHPLPDDYGKMYDWIKSQPENYRFMVFPTKSSYVFDSSKHSGIYPVFLQGMFFDFGDYLFVRKYARSAESVLSSYKSGEISKILGLTNVAAVIILPEYDYMWKISFYTNHTDVLKMFDFQKGMENFNISGNMTAYRNNDVLPRVYATANSALVVGGRGSLLSFALADLNFSDWAFFFSSQLKNDVRDVWKYFDRVIFYQKELDDLKLAMLDSRYKIDLWDYAQFASLGLPTEERTFAFWDNDEDYWLRFYSNYWVSQRGEFYEGKGLVEAGTTSKTKWGIPQYIKMEVPVKIENDGEYEIWLRRAVSEGELYPIDRGMPNGEFSLYIDYVFFEYFSSLTKNSSGLMWLRAGTVNLTKGVHTFSFWSREGINVLDQLAVVPKSVFDENSGNIVSLLSDKKKVMIKEAELSFLAKKGKWTKDRMAGSGDSYVLATKRKNAVVYTEFEIPNSENYTIALRVLANYSGKISINVDNQTSDLNLNLTPNNTAMYAGDSVGSLNQTLDFTQSNMTVNETNSAGPQVEFVWVETNPVFIEKGSQKIEVSKFGGGDFVIDEIAVHNIDSMKNIFSTGKKVDISWNFVNPTKYEAESNSDYPSFVILASNYDSQWRAITRDRQVQPLPVNSFANAFLIEPGMQEISLEYLPQRFVESGGKLTLIGFVIVFGYLIITAIIGKIKKNENK